MRSREQDLGSAYGGADLKKQCLYVLSNTERVERRKLRGWEVRFRAPNIEDEVPAVHAHDNASEDLPFAFGE